ncbi:hypothetical protein FRC02_003775 [Tulasnella sp. 418]|nr:hypothetical protein FRC02_003775 [Tulasnella sp. 418]
MSKPLARPRSPSNEEEESRASKLLKASPSGASQRLDVPSAEKKNLQDLLDLTNVTSPDFPSIFAEIADALLNRSRLKVECDGTVTTYQVLEVEFYLLDLIRHFDPFTHGESEQGISGMWYFHRVHRFHKTKKEQGSRFAPAPPSDYRDENRKGLDLTFGGPPSSTTTNDTIRGGILLRSLLRERDNKIITGPSLLVDEILNQSNASAIRELVEDKWQGDRQAFRSATDTPERQTHLYFTPYVGKLSSLPTVYNSPRVGLELSNRADQEDRIALVDRHYRFFIHPQRLTQKGRAQTFVGLWRHLQSRPKATVGLWRHMQSRSGGPANPPPINYSQLAKISGMAEATLKSYAGYYNAGRAKGAAGRSSLEEYLGAEGKGVSASIEKLLNMLGVLEGVRSDGKVTG